MVLERVSKSSVASLIFCARPGSTLAMSEVIRLLIRLAMSVGTYCVPLIWNITSRIVVHVPLGIVHRRG
jgi:hypothetical protein